MFDENLANAKLRRIENNAELKRANMVCFWAMQELFMRKRKMHKIKEEKHKENFLKDETAN